MQHRPYAHARLRAAVAIATALAGIGAALAPAAANAATSSSTPAVTITGQTGDSVWSPTAQAIVVNATNADTTWPIYSTTCQVDQGAPTTVQGAQQTLEVTGDGGHFIDCTAEAWDGIAGDQPIVSPVAFATELIDSQKPTIQFSGAPVAPTWNTTPQVATATATESTEYSGIATVTCNDGAGDSTSTPGPVDQITAPATGRFTISCQAISGSGVKSAVTTETLWDDTQAPVVTFPSAPTPTAWYNTGQPLTIQVTDPVTGAPLQSVSCDYNGSPLFADGSLSANAPAAVHSWTQTIQLPSTGSGTVSCQAEDQAANTSPVATTSVQLDTIAPTGAFIQQPSTPDVIQASVSDDLSGVASATIQYQQDGAWVNLPTTISNGVATAPMPADGTMKAGTHALQLLLADGAGNRTTISTYGDGTPAQLQVAVPTASFQPISANATSIQAAVGAGYSGVASAQIQYQAGGAWHNLSTTISNGVATAAVPTDGTLKAGDYPLSVTVTDNAHNQTTVTTMPDGPTATLHIDAPSAVFAQVATNAPSVTATLSAAFSGVKTAQFAYEQNGAWFNLPTTIKGNIATAQLPTDGTIALGPHPLHITVTDKSGNSTTSSIDKTGSTVALKLTAGTAAFLPVHTNPKRIQATVTGGFAGMKSASIAYEQNGSWYTLPTKISGGIATAKVPSDGSVDVGSHPLRITILDNDTNSASYTAGKGGAKTMLTLTQAAVKPITLAYTKVTNLIARKHGETAAVPGNPVIHLGHGKHSNITGVLRTNHGPVAHGKIIVTSRPDIDPQNATVTTIKTRKNGAWSYTVPAGQDRHLTIVYAGKSTIKSAKLTASVLGNTTSSLSVGRAHHGQPFNVNVKLHGGGLPAAGGVPVRLFYRTKPNHTWQWLGAIKHTAHDGVLSTTYPTPALPAGSSIQVQARVAASKGYGYDAAYSQVENVRILKAVPPPPPPAPQPLELKTERMTAGLWTLIGVTGKPATLPAAGVNVTVKWRTGTKGAWHHLASHTLAKDGRLNGWGVPVPNVAAGHTVQLQASAPEASGGKDPAGYQSPIVTVKVS